MESRADPEAFSYPMSHNCPRLACSQWGINRKTENEPRDPKGNHKWWRIIERNKIGFESFFLLGGPFWLVLKGNHEENRFVFVLGGSIEK